MELKLGEKQKEAVEICLDGSFRIVAVTGPAGSGKTTIIQHVVERLREEGKVIRVCAPTGKAARRITQATGVEAVTIHKLLEYPKPGERDEKTGKALNPGAPKRNYENPIYGDVIIADEYAMVNHTLDRNLLDALSKGARLLVFGDNNQLPPIEEFKLKTETQTPFQKHLDRKSVELDHVYRQDEDGGILFAANKIRKGNMPPKSDDFVYHFTEQPVKAFESYIKKAQEHGVEFNNIANQVICVQKGSWVGTHSLNRMMQDFYNGERVLDEGMELPRNKWDEQTPITVAIGDKVVCTENTYDMRPYHERYEQFNERDIGLPPSFIPTPDTKMMLNGETGVITDIRLDGALEVDFGDRIVEIPTTYTEYNHHNDSFYEKDARKAIDLAYALTTHKCQGSEFSRVVYIINRSRPFMLNRKNFYTAVTRAKEHVLVVCDQPSMRYSLRPFKEFKK